MELYTVEEAAWNILLARSPPQRNFSLHFSDAFLLSPGGENRDKKRGAKKPLFLGAAATYTSLSRYLIT